jgi:hypothetical protein
MKFPEMQTTDELIEVIKVIGWLFAVVVVMLVFGTIVIAFLYSIIFVTQPIKSLAPLDQAVLKMLNDIVLLLVGSITTLIGMYALNKGAKAVANRLMPAEPPPAPVYTPQQTWTAPSTALPTWINPPLDESWTPPPPPTTPPDHVESDEDRQALAQARQEVN